MSQTVQKVGVAARGDFVVYDANDDPVTGLVNADFDKLLMKNGANSAVVATVAEVGSGRYTVTFTPNAVGIWTLLVQNATYNPRGWIETFNVTTDGVLTLADGDTYQAKVSLTDDDANAADRYVVAWFKNGQPIVAGITNAKIEVYDADDVELIALTALAQIGATGVYVHVETVDRVASGAAYVAYVEATIDGSSRTWNQPVSRDSSA